jgi:hypothetical protein
MSVRLGLKSGKRSWIILSPELQKAVGCAIRPNLRFKSVPRAVASGSKNRRREWWRADLAIETPLAALKKGENHYDTES